VSLLSADRRAGLRSAKKRARSSSPFADPKEMLGHHGPWDEFVFHEPSLGVPLVCRVHRVTSENVQCRTLASLNQTAPTLAELCWLRVPRGLDGISFSQDLCHPQHAIETTVFVEFAFGTQESKSTMRRRDYKYCHYVNDLPELCGLRPDPRGMKNLALLPQYKSILRDIKTKLFSSYGPSQGEHTEGDKCHI
jgi:arylsulfatase A-like enzyme